MKSDWIFHIVRAQEWAISLNCLDDKSGYWLHIGPVSFNFGYVGLFPVSPLTPGVAWYAVRRWWAGGRVPDGRIAAKLQRR